jgi:putative membrane protein
MDCVRGSSATGLVWLENGRCSHLWIVFFGWAENEGSCKIKSSQQEMQADLEVVAKRMNEEGGILMLIHWIVLTLALLIVSHLYSGLQVANLPAAIVAAAVLGILNALVRPVLQFFALPITFLTLGLFYFVINGLMLYWTAYLVEGLVVRSFGAAVLASILVSLCSLVLNALFGGSR